jgi:hypothetical protein
MVYDKHRLLLSEVSPKCIVPNVASCKFLKSRDSARVVVF